MRSTKDIILALAASAASLQVAAAFKPATVKKGDPPLVVAEAHRDFNGDGKPDTLTIALVEGRRYNDENLWCGMGWKDEGQFTITISIAEGGTCFDDLNSLTASDSLWFREASDPLDFADYNHDGQEDVAVSQYGACTSSVWFLLTVSESGSLTRLSVPDGSVDAEEIVLTRDGFRTHSFFSGEDWGKDYGWDVAKGAFVARPLRDVPTITIRNMSPVDVAHVYISKRDEAYWGEDWLGEDDFLEAGTAWEFDVAGGEYEVMTTDDGDTPLERWQGVVPPSDLRIGEEGHARIEVVNESGECLDELVVGQWGRLAFGETIAPGDKRVVFVAPGTYDLSAEGCAGTFTIAKKQVNVAESFRWVLSPRDVQRHPLSVPRYINCKPSAAGVGYITVSP